MYRITLFFVHIFSLLPFPVLYGISDFIYLIVYYVVRYRKKVVRENLMYSFPDLSNKERLIIEKKFYHHFCDLFLEALKAKSMKREDFDKRMVYFGVDEMKKHFDENRSVMFLAAHYGNWEWLASLSCLLPPERYVYQAYKQQKGAVADKIMGTLRSKFGGKNLEINNLYRSLSYMKSENQMGLVLMISDQSPTRDNIRFRTTFLNQDTPVIDGTEQIARKLDYPVYYCSIKKLKRGYYSASFSPISLQPKDTEKGEITEKYARMLEKDILENPAYWLWTHKRWKNSTNRNVNNKEIRK